MISSIPSKRVLVVLGLLAVCILMCLSFLAGAKTTERRARHFDNWSNHYPEMMRSHRGNRKPIPQPMPHGVFGRVLSVTGTSMIIEGRDHFEQNVIVGGRTILRNPWGAATSSDVQPNMEVGVFGVPNSLGQIEAQLIRLFPEQNASNGAQR